MTPPPEVATTDAATTEAAPRPGRPRSAQADAAILDATVDLFADLGFEGTSIEAVAERAGVAKSTVYRRYPTKIDLVMAAWLHCSPGVEPSYDTGRVESDLLAAAHKIRWVYTESPVGRAIPSALVAAARFPEFAQAYRAFLVERRAPVVAAVEAAIARGELAADADADVVVDLVIGPVFYRSLTTQARLTDDDLVGLVEHAVAAFRP
jgi:AcrR family transcriptional regulator